MLASRCCMLYRCLTCLLRPRPRSVSKQQLGVIVGVLGACAHRLAGHVLVSSRWPIHSSQAERLRWPHE